MTLPLSSSIFHNPTGIGLLGAYGDHSDDEGIREVLLNFQTSGASPLFPGCVLVITCYQRVVNINLKKNFVTHSSNSSTL